MKRLLTAFSGKPYESYGIPSKLVRMVNAMYDGSQCAVVEGTGQTDWFDVKSGAKQGCNISGFLFLLVIDWIMRRTGANTGIRWKLWSKLDDLGFADDIALTSTTKCQFQQKVTYLSTNSKTAGLKINSEKTKLLRLNTTSNENVQVDEHDIEEVESFMYLGAYISKIRSGRIVNLRTRLRSKFSNQMSSRGCCMVANAGE